MESTIDLSHVYFSLSKILLMEGIYNISIYLVHHCELYLLETWFPKRSLVPDDQDIVDGSYLQKNSVHSVHHCKLYLLERLDFMRDLWYLMIELLLMGAIYSKFQYIQFTITSYMCLRDLREVKTYLMVILDSIQGLTVDLVPTSHYIINQLARPSMQYISSQ